jgi:hypothetical protein
VLVIGLAGGLVLVAAATSLIVRCLFCKDKISADEESGGTLDDVSLFTPTPPNAEHLVFQEGWYRTTELKPAMPELDLLDNAGLEAKPAREVPPEAHVVPDDIEKYFDPCIEELLPAVCRPKLGAGAPPTEDGIPTEGAPMLCARELQFLIPWLAWEASNDLRIHLTTTAAIEVADGVAALLREGAAEGPAEALGYVAKLYTQDAVYGGVNAFLRHFDPESPLLARFGHYIVLLQIYLMTCEHPAEPLTLWRGMENDAAKVVAAYQEVIGKVVLWPPFTSTTESFEVAMEFAGDSGVLFEIEIDEFALPFAALGAVDVCQLSAYPEEAEVLLATSIPLRVLGIEMAGARTMIKLKVDSHELARLQNCLEQTSMRWMPGFEPHDLVIDCPPPADDEREIEEFFRTRRQYVELPAFGPERRREEPQEPQEAQEEGCSVEGRRCGRVSIG